MAPKPKAVVAAAKRAADLQKDFASQQQPATAIGTSVEVPAANTNPEPGKEVPPQPAQVTPEVPAVTPTQPRLAQLAAQTAEPPAQPEQPARSEQPAAPTDDPPTADDYRQQYRTLQGKYNADMAALRAELASMKQQMVAQQPVPQEQVQNRVTPAMREEFGDDLLAVVKAQVDDLYSDKFAQMQATIERLRSELAHTSKVTERVQVTTVEQYLDNAVANWRNIDTDPRFISWLSERDAFSGQTRQNLLDHALAAKDAPRVAEFFLAYTGRQPAPTAQPEPPPVAKVDTLVGPGTQRQEPVHAPPGEAPKPTISRSDIREFYDEVRKGRYSKDPETQRRIETMIAEASAEGRIV